jgi:hypothetical protein
MMRSSTQTPHVFADVIGNDSVSEFLFPALFLLRGLRTVTKQGWRRSFFFFGLSCQQLTGHYRAKNGSAKTHERSLIMKWRSANEKQ